MVKTHRQQKVVKRTIEELAKNKPLNKGKILEDIGYTKNTAKTPSAIYNGQYVKSELDNVIKAMEKNRNEAIKSLKSKLGKAQYNHAIQGIDVLTKNIELLSGRATERKEDKLDDEQVSNIAQEILKRKAKVSE